jgi:GntR family transcriptional regulator
MVAHALDPRSATPLYRQLAADLRRRITAGDFPSHWLPSKTDLLGEYSTENRRISIRTINDGLALLRTEGLIETVPGKGIYVR